MTERGPLSPADEMREYIRRQVATGFLDADEVEEAAVDCFMDELDESRLDPAMLRRIAGVEKDRAFAAQLDAQRQWPAVTDCDRLDRAFADLDRSGIVARQNFTCCQTCGHAEIGEEIDTAEKSGTIVTGYTFFHWQGTEGAVEGGSLYLYYGSVPGDGDTSIRIGHAIVETLKRCGLAVDWNGRLDTAIRVELTWQRRVTQEMARRGTRGH